MNFSYRLRNTFMICGAALLIVVPATSAGADDALELPSTPEETAAPVPEAPESDTSVEISEASSDVSGEGGLVDDSASSVDTSAGLATGDADSGLTSDRPKHTVEFQTSDGRNVELDLNNIDEGNPEAVLGNLGRFLDEQIIGYMASKKGGAADDAAFLEAARSFMADDASNKDAWYENVVRRGEKALGLPKGSITPAMIIGAAAAQMGTSGDEGGYSRMLMQAYLEFNNPVVKATLTPDDALASTTAAGSVAATVSAQTSAPPTPLSAPPMGALPKASSGTSSNLGSVGLLAALEDPATMAQVNNTLFGNGKLSTTPSGVSPSANPVKAPAGQAPTDRSALSGATSVASVATPTTSDAGRVDWRNYTRYYDPELARIHSNQDVADEFTLWLQSASADIAAAKTSGSDAEAIRNEAGRLARERYDDMRTAVLQGQLDIDLLDLYAVSAQADFSDWVPRPTVSYASNADFGS